MIWTRNGTRQLYGMYERPPFPIMIDAPTAGDIARELRVADGVMFASIYAGGIGWAYLASRPFTMVTQRLLAFHGISHMFMITAACMTLTMPYRRLTGYADNGLRWTTPADKLKKFDCTSQFERSTIWGRFRVRPEE